MTLSSFAVATVVANALTFSDVTITGPVDLLGAGNSEVTWFNTDNDIDFFFNTACVGDNYPLKLGTINITFEVTAGANEGFMFCDLLSASTQVMGGGYVRISEAIESLDNGGVNTDFVETFAPGGILTKNINTANLSKHIKVKKTIFLLADDTTAGRDEACVGLIEQSIKTTAVPEPATYAAFGLGAALLIARRRRK